MSKHKKVIEEEIVSEESHTDTPVSKIFPIEVTFSNGDDNLLRDKVNEIIAKHG